MSVESDFEDTVKICEFYADPYDDFDVDLENGIVRVSGYEVSLVMRGGRLDCYLVIDPDGVSHWERDLDSFFQRVFAWQEFV